MSFGTTKDRVCHGTGWNNHSIASRLGWCEFDETSNEWMGGNTHEATDEFLRNLAYMLSHTGYLNCLSYIIDFRDENCRVKIIDAQNPENFFCVDMW